MAYDIPSRKRIGQPNWDDLIPPLKQYFTPGPTAPEEFAIYETNMEVAIGFSELFWPPFIVYDGMVFRGTEVEAEGKANIANWMKAFDNNKAKVEQMLNHDHLIDLFCERNREGTGAQIAYLASVLRDAWAAKLKVDFPDRAFTVDLYMEPEGSTGEDAKVGDWEITFYQGPPLTG